MMWRRYRSLLLFAALAGLLIGCTLVAAAPRLRDGGALAGVGERASMAARTEDEVLAYSVGVTLNRASGRHKTADQGGRRQLRFWDNFDFGNSSSWPSFDSVDFDNSGFSDAFSDWRASTWQYSTSKQCPYASDGTVLSYNGSALLSILQTEEERDDGVEYNRTLVELSAPLEVNGTDIATRLRELMVRVKRVEEATSELDVSAAYCPDETNTPPPLSPCTCSPPPLSPPPLSPPPLSPPPLSPPPLSPPPLSPPPLSPPPLSPPPLSPPPCVCSPPLF